MIVSDLAFSSVSSQCNYHVFEVAVTVETKFKLPYTLRKGIILSILRSIQLIAFFA